MASKRNFSATATTTTALRECRNKREKKELLSIREVAEKLLRSSRENIKNNDLRILLNNINNTESLLYLHSFFVFHLPASVSSNCTGRVSNSDGDHVPDSELRSIFDDLVSQLVHIASSSSQCNFKLITAVLNAIMDFVKLGNGGNFCSSLYHRLIQALVYSPLENEFFLKSLALQYFKYTDVRYFTLITMETLCKTLESRNNSGDNLVMEGANSQASLELSISKIHFILSRIPPPDDLYSDIEVWSKEGDNQEHPKHKEGKDDQKQKDKSTKIAVLLKKMKLKFTKAWMSFLRLPLPVDLYKEVLVNLHQAVIPHLSRPIMLCVLALSGLFILMTKYGLEYPNFYQKLYALLVPSVFMTKHRAKFFELLDGCLKSPLLPAYLAAAFTKKLSRLSLVVTPSGALVIIALVHNLLRRHPSISCLVHQDACVESYQDNTSPQESVSSDGNPSFASDVTRKKLGADVFNDKENDPSKSNAMRSSLWEIDALRHHYCPPVSRFLLSLENELTVRAKTTEMMVGDFSLGSYSTIFREQMKRRVKKAPLAFYKVTPTSLFSESEFPGWTFNCAE